MTGKEAGMTGNDAGMTGNDAGMTEVSLAFADGTAS